MKNTKLKEEFTPPKTDKEVTSFILHTLEVYHTKNNRRGVFFPELRLGGGYSGIAQRRIDLFHISSDAGYATTAYEIKASRGDFLRDIKEVQKQRGARLYSNFFYYVAPIGIISPEEVPDWAGLILIDTTISPDAGYRPMNMQRIISAPYREKSTPSWGLICSICRKYNKQLGENG